MTHGAKVLAISLPFLAAIQLLALATGGPIGFTLQGLAIAALVGISLWAIYRSRAK